MAGLTKQQEIIVGVGILALLGYFAFKTPEKPLQIESDLPPEDPGFPLIEKEVQKKAALYDFEVKKRQEILGVINERCLAFQKKFDVYIAQRTQLEQRL